MDDADLTKSFVILFISWQQHTEYTVDVIGQCLRKEVWHHLTLFEMNKWTILLMWLQYLFNLLALENYICSPAEREKLHFERKQNLPLPGTLCSLLCSEVLTDRNMKSGCGPTEALLLQAQTEPAAGSYWASYIMSPSLLMKLSSSHQAMLHIKLLISNSDNTCRNAPLLCHCPVEQFYSWRANINMHMWFRCIVLFLLCFFFCLSVANTYNSQFAPPVCSLALKPFLNLCIQFQHQKGEVLLTPFPYHFICHCKRVSGCEVRNSFPLLQFFFPFFLHLVNDVVTITLFHNPDSKKVGCCVISILTSWVPASSYEGIAFWLSYTLYFNLLKRELLSPLWTLYCAIYCCPGERSIVIFCIKKNPYEAIKWLRSTSTTCHYSVCGDLI